MRHDPIALDKIAKAGTKLRFRFDFGRDGCNGVAGWAVENVSVSFCEDEDGMTDPVITGSGGRGRATIKVDGDNATGSITVTEAGASVGTFSLRREAATFRAPASTHTYEVSYSGDGKNNPLRRP